MTNPKLTKLLADLDIKEPITTTIGEDLEFHGKLVIKNGSGIAILGTVEGEIVSDGTVVVGGVVKGTLTANVVAVAGTVDNNEGAEDAINARVSLVLGSSARIGSKSINYGSIEMERGCRIDGTLKFVEPSKEIVEKHDSRLKVAADSTRPFADGIPASLLQPHLLQTQVAPVAAARALPVIAPADRGSVTPAVATPTPALSTWRQPAEADVVSADVSAAPVVRQVAA